MRSRGSRRRAAGAIITPGDRTKGEDMGALLDTGLAALAFSRRTTERLLDGFDASNAMTRCGPEGSHVLYIAGHIAATDEAFLTMVGGQAAALEPRYNTVFGMNVEPTDDASSYPAFDEVRAAMSSRRDALVAWFSSMDDEALLQELPEPMIGFARTYAILMSTLAFHEGFHAGQISAARRVLGLPRALG